MSLCIAVGDADGRRTAGARGAAGVDAEGQPADMMSRFRDPDAELMDGAGVPALADRPGSGWWGRGNEGFRTETDRFFFPGSWQGGHSTLPNHERWGEDRLV